MSRSNSQRHRPKRDDVAVVSWLVSRRIWMGTLVFVGLLLAALIALAPVYFGTNAVGTLRRATALPASVLAVFLAARALSLAVTQRYRDRLIRAGEETPGMDVSVIGMLTVASFSTVGLLAAVVALPLVVSASGLVNVVAVAVAVLIVPITFPLQIHHLTEKSSADRQRRGYRVSPAVWTFLWTLPVVVLTWFVAISHPPASVYVPETVAGVSFGSSLVGRSMAFGVWHLVFVTICTPTVLVVGYVARRTVSATLRGLLP